MKALLQRVSSARVTVDGDVIGEIDRGLLVLLGLDQGDDLEQGRRLLEKLLSYRVFPDAEGRMNCSVRDVTGGVLLVSQFTLSAITRKGLRPSFSSALPPAEAELLFGQLLASGVHRLAGVEPSLVVCCEAADAGLDDGAVGDFRKRSVIRVV